MNENYEKPLPHRNIKTSKINIKLLILAGVIIIAAAAAGLLWQQNRVNDLNDKITQLEQTQMPQQKYATYENCVHDGGVLLNTINGQFDACLGGSESETEELQQHQAFLQYSAQNLPNISENKKTDRENKVVSKDTHSQDLVDFLKYDYSGCETRGEYEIVKELPGRFALMKYGCDGDGQVQSANPPTIIGMKLADGWVLLSPTNNMDAEGRPSCLLADMFKVSKDLAPKCFENTGYNNGVIRDVSYR